MTTSKMRHKLRTNLLHYRPAQSTEMSGIGLGLVIGLVLQAPSSHSGAHLQQLTVCTSQFRHARITQPCAIATASVIRMYGKYMP